MPINNTEESPGVASITTVSGSTIHHQLAEQSAKHPLTVVPLGIAALAAVHFVVLAPVFGAGGFAATAAGISTGLALANFAFRYRSDRADIASSLQHRLQIETSRLRDSDLRKESRRVQAGLKELGLAEGLTVLRRLCQEYERLQDSSREAADNSFSAPHITALVDETYRRGLGVLASAVELSIAVSTPGREQINREIARLETEVSAGHSADEAAQHASEHLQIKAETLAMQKRQLQELDRLQLHVEELLFQGRRCEFSLHHARIEFAAIKSGNSNSGLSTVIEALEGTVKRAKEVQEELKNLGY